MVRLSVPIQDLPFMSVGVSGPSAMPLLLVSRPDAGQLAKALCATAVNGGLDEGEDSSLDGGRGQARAPAARVLRGLWPLPLAGHHLPELLEHCPGNDPAQNAEDD